MQFFSAVTLKTLRRTRLKTAFSLSIFLITVSLPCFVPAQQIKVCVKDANDKNVTEKLFITIFNTNARIDVSNPNSDKCFTSIKGKFDPAKTYFVVAVKEDKLGVSEFKVNGEDKNRPPVNVTLKKQSEKADVKSIAICAEDKNKKPIRIESISSSVLDPDFKLEVDKETGCANSRLSAANEYKLQLDTLSAAATPYSFAGIKGLPGLLLFLMSVTLLLSIGIFLTIWSMRNPQEAVSSARLIGEIHEKVRSMSGSVLHIESRIDEWKIGGFQVKHTNDVPTDGEPEKLEAADIDLKDAARHESVGGHYQIDQEQPILPEAAELPLINHHIAEAKQKYTEFCGEKQVDHFSLMPLGDSSASQMISEAKVKLREQSFGTYIAFGSSDAGMEAWVFPRPGLHYTPEKFGALFPDLTEQEYQNGNVEPKRAVSMGSKLWMVD